jgi:hypothetical protein
MTQVPKREFWNNAEPERLPDQWRLTQVKGDHTMTAVCECWAVEMGWDLRLMIDGHGLQLASLCRSGREWSIALTSGAWRWLKRAGRDGDSEPCGLS